MSEVCGRACNCQLPSAFLEAETGSLLATTMRRWLKAACRGYGWYTDGSWSSSKAEAVSP